MIKVIPLSPLICQCVAYAHTVAPSVLNLICFIESRQAKVILVFSGDFSSLKLKSSCQASDPVKQYKLQHTDKVVNSAYKWTVGEVLHTMGAGGLNSS